MDYRERLHDEQLELQAQRITRDVLATLRENGDNLDILAAVRRALLDHNPGKVTHGHREDTDQA